MFAVCLYRSICPKYSSLVRPVFIESHGREAHGARLGGEGTTVVWGGGCGESATDVP